MRTIYRWVIPIGRETPLTAPWSVSAVTRVETVGGNSVEFWAEIDTRKPSTTRDFLVVGTGHQIPDGWHVLATADRTRTGLVWHLLVRLGHSDPDTAITKESRP